MSLPAVHDFTIYRGETFTATISIKDPDGDAIDYTGYTVEMDICPSPYSDDVLLSLTEDNGRITNNGTTIDITIPADDTAAIEWTVGSHDLKLTSSAGTVVYPIRGKVVVTESVTD